MPRQEDTRRADMASEKYAATRWAEVPNGVAHSEISRSILFASSYLSPDTASAHWRRRVRRWRPSSSRFLCRISSLSLAFTAAGGGAAALGDGGDASVAGGAAGSCS